MNGFRLTDQEYADRRRLPRTPASGKVIATISRDEGVGVTTVELVDTSACGIGVRSPIEAHPGDLLGLHFDGTAMPSRLGRVVRCQRDGDGYQIGLAAEQKKAVA